MRSRTAVPAPKGGYLSPEAPGDRVFFPQLKSESLENEDSTSTLEKRLSWKPDLVIYLSSLKGHVCTFIEFRNDSPSKMKVGQCLGFDTNQLVIVLVNPDTPTDFF